MVSEELWDFGFLGVGMCFWKLKQAGISSFSAEIEVVYLYQHFKANLEVFLAISEGGQSDVSMVAIEWL